LRARDMLNTLASIAAKGAGFRSLGDTMGRHHDGSAAVTRENLCVTLRGPTT